jgi:hypothetical protein
MRATITMPLETLKAIIERAREYEFVEDDELLDEDLEDEDEEDEEIDDEDEDETPILVADNDDELEVDEEEGGDEEEGEFEDVLEGLTSDELAELLSLAMIGDGEKSDWDSALKAAKALASDDVIVQLAENPTLSDSIERGLAALGYEISED